LKKLNPLDVLEIRRVDFCSPKFATANIEKSYNIEQAIVDWIEEHMTGRFYFGPNVILDEDNSLKSVYTVGFEQKKEMSYFMLACPHLKY